MRFISMALVAMLSFGLSSAAHAQSVDNSDAAIADHIERLVTRPQLITLSHKQRTTIDSLKVVYVRAARTIEANRAADPMTNAQNFRKMQNEFQDFVLKLMTPSQIDDFQKNLYASAFRSKTPQ